MTVRCPGSSWNDPEGVVDLCELSKTTFPGSSSETQLIFILLGAVGIREIQTSRWELNLFSDFFFFFLSDYF